MRPVLSLPEERVVLHKVSWESYERLAAEDSDPSSPRFTIDHRELTVVNPSAEHGRHSRRIADLIGLLADQMGLEVEDLDSATFSFEPGCCFTFRTLSGCWARIDSMSQ